MSKTFILNISLISILLHSCWLDADRSVEGGIGNSFIQKNRVIDTQAQQKLYKGLMILTENRIPEYKLSDSVSFLIIPIDAACNSCRNKATKATFQNKNILKPTQFVIFSSNGMKNIKSYFQEQNVEISHLESNIFLDPDNLAFSNDLMFMHPMVYYCNKGTVLAQIKCVPINIDQILKYFFNR